MTDTQWDDLIEMFEVVKYGAAQEGIKRRPEKDIQRSSAENANRQHQRATTFETVPISRLAGHRFRRYFSPPQTMFPRIPPFVPGRMSSHPASLITDE